MISPNCRLMEVFWAPWRWDRLGPGTLCCGACTWTHLSSSNKIQGNCKGLKITVCMRSWGKFWTKDTKQPKNPTATSEEPGAKAGYCPCPLHTAPPKGWAKHLSHPSCRPLDTLLPSPHVRNHPAPPSASEQGHLFLVSLLLLQQGPP